MLDGGYLENLFPIIAPSGSSWNLPAVNLDKFQSLGDAPFARHNCMSAVLPVISDDECEGAGNRSFAKFKAHLGQVFSFINRQCNSPDAQLPAIGIAYEKKIKFILFVTGVSMEDSSHSFVIEVFLMKPSGDPKRGTLPLTCFNVAKDELAFWNSMFPAIVERCRTWEHGNACQYDRDRNFQGVCLCGLGLVNSRFTARSDWIEFAPNVVRCALSPLFPAPFIHETWKTVTALPRQLEDKDDEFYVIAPGGLGGTDLDIERDPHTKIKCCRVCGANGRLKKCGRCEKVFYCGQECQKKDWTRHKSECRTAGQVEQGTKKI